MITRRGLGAGLGETAPTFDLLKTDGCRAFRRKLQVLAQCSRTRGVNAISEGACLVMTLLQGEAAEATEDIDLELLETKDALQLIFSLLGECCKCDNQAEPPTRANQFFSASSLASRKGGHEALPSPPPAWGTGTRGGRNGDP